MNKTKFYPNTKFSPVVLREATQALINLKPEGKDKRAFRLNVAILSEIWTHDNIEEFFADYNKDINSATYAYRNDDFDLTLVFEQNATAVSITASTREAIEALHSVFEAHKDKSKIAAPKAKKPRIAIGHGHNPAWDELKDHLHEKHGYEVQAYETGARAGHTIRDVLQNMLDSSSFAILVMTGEDQQLDGQLRARQNVIHEVGLFQGKLGFSRAIVLLEEGTEDFSNLAGIQWIAFSKGKIKETFGEVLATLRREFGTD